MKVIVISTQSGDWKTLYVDGKSVLEGHELPTLDFLAAAEKYKFKANDIQYAELNDEDDEKVALYGAINKIIDPFKYYKEKN